MEMKEAKEEGVVGGGVLLVGLGGLTAKQTAAHAHAWRMAAWTLAPACCMCFIFVCIESDESAAVSVN